MQQQPLKHSPSASIPTRCLQLCQTLMRVLLKTFCNIFVSGEVKNKLDIACAFYSGFDERVPVTVVFVTFKHVCCRMMQCCFQSCCALSIFCCSWLLCSLRLIEKWGYQSYFIIFAFMLRVPLSIFHSKPIFEHVHDFMHSAMSVSANPWFHEILFKNKNEANLRHVECMVCMPFVYVQAFCLFYIQSLFTLRHYKMDLTGLLASWVASDLGFLARAFALHHPRVRSQIASGS